MRSQIQLAAVDLCDRARPTCVIAQIKPSRSGLGDRAGEVSGLLGHAATVFRISCVAVGGWVSGV